MEFEHELAPHTTPCDCEMSADRIAAITAIIISMPANTDIKQIADKARCSCRDVLLVSGHLSKHHDSPTTGPVARTEDI